MGSRAWVVRRLSNFNETAPSTSPVFDLADAVELHAILKIVDVFGTARPALSVKAQHSIDSLHWLDIDGMTFSPQTLAAIETKSATGALFRWVRFVYELSGMNPSATFEVVAHTKDRTLWLPIQRGSYFDTLDRPLVL